MMRRLQVVVMATLLVGSLFVAPGAATAKAPGIDKAAILRVGADLTTAGGANLDPATSGNAVSTDAAVFYMPYLYDTMLRVDAKGALRPGLASKWSTPDANTVLLTIRSGVKFQDGTPFTADAVKQAWDRIRAVPPSTAPHEELWNKITSIDVVGTDQIKVSLSVPSSGSFLTKILSVGASSVPSPTAYAKYGADYKFHPVGAGPYAFDSFQPGQKVSLRKWNGYWDAKDSQRVGGIDVIQTGAGAPTVANLQTGQIDLAKVSVADTPGLKGQPNIAIDTFNNTSASLYLLPCTNKAPFNNADARAAVSTAIDRKAINQVTYNGTGTPAETVFPKGSPYYAAELEGKHAYNVKQAKRLATKGGIQPGTSIKLMVTASSAGADRAGVVIQDQLTKIGLNTEIITTTNFVADQKRLNPDLILVATDSSSVSSFLTVGGIPNWCQYNNPAVESAFATILSSADGAAAAKAPWRTVQEIMVDDATFMVLAHAPILWARSKQVGGFELAPNIRNIPIVWHVSMTRKA